MLRDIPEPSLKGRHPKPSSGERPVKEKGTTKPKPASLDDLI